MHEIKTDFGKGILWNKNIWSKVKVNNSKLCYCGKKMGIITILFISHILSAFILMTILLHNILHKILSTLGLQKSFSAKEEPRQYVCMWWGWGGSMASIGPILCQFWFQVSVPHWLKLCARVKAWFMPPSLFPHSRWSE